MADAFLFVCNRGWYNIWILVYVDDLNVTWDNSKVVENIIKIIFSEFRCRDLGGY